MIRSWFCLLVVESGAAKFAVRPIKAGEVQFGIPVSGENCISVR